MGQFVSETRHRMWSRVAALVVLSASCHAGLLGAGQGEGSCAAPPFRSLAVKWSAGCPEYASCCTEFGYCRGRDEWIAGNFRDCNGLSNGSPLEPGAIAAENAAAAAGDVSAANIIVVPAGQSTYDLVGAPAPIAAAPIAVAPGAALPAATPAITGGFAAAPVAAPVAVSGGFAAVPAAAVASNGAVVSGLAANGAVLNSGFAANGAFVNGLAAAPAGFAANGFAAAPAGVAANGFAAGAVPAGVAAVNYGYAANGAAITTGYDVNGSPINSYLAPAY